MEIAVPQFLKRIRSALFMGLVWGGVWAIVGGFIMEGIIDPNGEIVDMWPQLLGIVGFMGGVIFSGVITALARQRGLDEFSFREFAGLGALTGVLQGVLAMLVVGAPLLFLAVTTSVSALVACGTLGVVRVAERRLSLPR
jgi:hypothetical protein